MGCINCNKKYGLMLSEDFILKNSEEEELKIIVLNCDYSEAISKHKPYNIPILNKIYIITIKNYIKVKKFINQNTELYLGNEKLNYKIQELDKNIYKIIIK
jgi:hypothetical protein